jgi:hypothetical protein
MPHACGSHTSPPTSQYRPHRRGGVVCVIGSLMLWRLPEYVACNQAERDERDLA